MAIDFEFDDRQYLLVSNEANYDITAAITVTCWVKVESLTRTWQAIYTKGDSTWRLHRHSNSNGFTLHLSGVSNPGSAGNINDGLWHHIAGTYDGSAIRLYQDGVLQLTQNTSGTINTDNREVRIASNSQRSNREWDGLIDDARVYNRGLSGAEISTIYASEGTDGIFSGLVSRHLLNELANGLTVVQADDLGSEGNNATPMGTTDPVYGLGMTRARRKVA